MDSSSNELLTTNGFLCIFLLFFRLLMGRSGGLSELKRRSDGLHGLVGRGGGCVYSERDRLSFGRFNDRRFISTDLYLEC